MNGSVLITRVVLKNYKSIASCSVRLCPLNFLVGQNGSGKSNFLDALRFAGEALNSSLVHALRERGGINEVRRRSLGHPNHLGMRLEFVLPDSTSGFYAFRVGPKPNGGFEVQREECRLYARETLQEDTFFVVNSGVVTESNPRPLPPAAEDRLFLAAVSHRPEFRPLYTCLTHMGFYQLNPDKIRDWQPVDAGPVLLRDGGNLASMLNRLSTERPWAKARVVELLSKVVPGVVDVATRHIGNRATLEFRQKVGGNELPWRFLAENMSEGTLRALGVLTALFQSANRDPDQQAALVAIEEPEAALHPGAAGVLRNALLAASLHTQVIATSNRADLLDDESLPDQALLAVSHPSGETMISPLGSAGRSGIREHLGAAAEPLSLGERSPNSEASEETPGGQLDLFRKSNG